MFIREIIRAQETRAGLGLALGLSLVIKSVLLVALAEEPINRDGFLYIAAAQKFAQAQAAEALELFPLPLFPIFIAGVHTVVPDWLLAARLVSFFALLTSLVPLYLITRDILGPRAAFFATLAAALAPYPNEFVIAANRGALYFSLLAWAVYFAQRAVAAPRPALFFWAALFSVLAGLCRKEGGVFAAMCSLFFFFCLLRSEGPERWAILKGLAAWTAVFVFPTAAIAVVLGLQSSLLEYVHLFRAEFDTIVELRFLDNYQQLYAQLKMWGDNSLYPTWGQDFAEIARHYIPVIYLIGMIEELVIVMFPPFLIALLVGIRHPQTRSSALILWIVGCYLVLVYYNHISRNFIQSRFLFAPALLLYPWIGLGLDKLWTRLRHQGGVGWLSVLFAGFFFISALVDTGGLIARRDPSLATAGRWVKEQREFQAARTFFNDGRVAFHAGRSWQEFEFNRRLWQEEGTPIDKFAREHGFDVVVLLLRPGGERHALGEFNSFVRQKAFEGRRYCVEVYSTPGFGAPHEAAEADGRPVFP